MLGLLTSPVRRNSLCVAIALFAGSVAVYLPALRGQFVYDDIPQIVVDDFIHHPANFSTVVSLRVLGLDVIDNNRPAMIASLMLDSLVWQREPFGYHLTNVLLHAGCVVLVFLLTTRLLKYRRTDGRVTTREMLGAALGAAMLMLHPVCTEAVAAVAFREDLLATFFTLAGLLTAAKLSITVGTLRSAMRIAGASCCFFLAASSKETGVAGPVALVPMAACLAFRGVRGRWIAQIVIAAGAVSAFIVARFAWAPSESIVFANPPQRLGGSVAEWLSIQRDIWALDVQQIIWPRWLCADYNQDAVAHWSETMRSAMVVTFLTALALAAWWVRAAAVGVVLFLAGLLPASNVLPMFCPSADRYLYLPMAGLAIIVGALLAAVMRSAGRTIAIATVVAAAVPLTFFAWLTIERQRAWHDAQSLWTETLKVNPTSVAADLGLGVDLLDRGEPQQALPHLRRAIVHSGGPSGELLAVTASCVEQLGNLPAAELMLQEAVRLEPRFETPELTKKGLFWQPSAIERLAPIARRIGLSGWAERPSVENPGN